MANNPVTLVLIGGSILIVLVSIIGLVYLAGQDISTRQIVIPILASIVTGFATAAAAIVTHVVGSNFEIQRTNIVR
jgi:hypothetical protein